MLTARSGDQLEDLRTALSPSGCSVAAEAVDLTDPAAIAPAMSNLLSQGDAPSVLVNNAGAAYTGDLLAMTLERWQWLLQRHRMRLLLRPRQRQLSSRRR